MQELSGMTGTVAETNELFEQSERGASGQTVPQEPMTPQQKALKAANMLMDQVVCGEIASFDGIRPQLSAHYNEAGLTDVAAFIEATTRMNMARGSLAMGIPSR